MEQRTAGSSALEVSVLGYGCWQFGSKGEEDYWGLEFTQEMANDFVRKAAELGITYFDTAEDYAGGDSETQLGSAVKALAPEVRAKVVIGSKIKPNSCGDPEAAVAGTLSRLGVDCVDLYMVHWPIDKNSMAHFAGHGKNAAGGRDYASRDESAAADVPDTASTFAALKRLQDAGKIKHIGVSNFGKTQLQEALATGAKIVSNQVCYNLIFRAVEFDILPFCRENGIGVLAYSPLMQGLLTGRWTDADSVPQYRARSRHFKGTRPLSRHGEDGHEELLFSTLAGIKAVSDECGVPMADLALAWLTRQAGITGVIAGATKMSQLERSCAAAKLQLSDEVVAKLTAATDDLKAAMGSNADLWQGADGRIR